MIRRVRLSCWLWLTAFLVGGSAVAADQGRWFRPGDRWVALGDSITQGGSYHQQLELFLLTRNLQQDVGVFNAGISGDTVTGALSRLDWDVLAHQPSVVSIMFGMNDVGRYLYESTDSDAATQARRKARIDSWEKDTRELIARLQRQGVRVIACTPSPFDENVQSTTPNLPGVDAALSECGRRLVDIARETGAALVDFHGPMGTLNRSLQRRDPTATLISAGRVHPGPVGHLVMAYLMLKAAGERPLVAKLSVDATTLRSTGCEHGEVSAIRSYDGGIEFTARAHALPFPTAAESRPALKLVPLASELNRELLQVHGLTGRLEVRIDEVAVGVFSARQLAEGIDLASLADTPQLRQAKEVQACLQRKWAAAGKLRNIAYCEYRASPDEPRPVDSARMPEKLERWLDKSRPGSSFRYIEGEARNYQKDKPQQAALEHEVADWTSRARAAAIPRPRLFVIRPVAAP
jgi:lysophospholipase L1-like esterase